MATLSLPLWRLSGLFLVILAGTGCRNVEFWEKEDIGRSIMGFDEGSAEQHFQQKCFYSIEGAAGGLGTSAGGGCGCY